MPKLNRSFKTTLLVFAVFGVLSGCQKKEEGPAETAGKQIDQAIQKSGEKLDQATEEVGKSIEQAGQRMQDAAQQDGK
jgi:vacuolar-type H+-ATPase subunit H